MENNNHNNSNNNREQQARRDERQDRPVGEDVRRDERQDRHLRRVSRAKEQLKPRPQRCWLACIPPRSPLDTRFALAVYSGDVSAVDRVNTVGYGWVMHFIPTLASQVHERHGVPGIWSGAVRDGNSDMQG